MKTITFFVLFSFISTTCSSVFAQSGDTIKTVHEKVLELDDDQQLLDIQDMRSCARILETTAKPKIFYNVEQMPVFPGGESQMISYIKENLQYPARAKAQNIRGEVIVEIVVDQDGFVTDPKILKSVSPECDKEAIRIVKLMPKWEPGKEKGKAVPVYYILRIVFKPN